MDKYQKFCNKFLGCNIKWRAGGATNHYYSINSIIGYSRGGCRNLYSAGPPTIILSLNSVVGRAVDFGIFFDEIDVEWVKENNKEMYEELFLIFFSE